MKLKPKEKLFCFYFSKLQNSREAAIKAGYPTLFAEKQGDKLLLRKEILTEINSFSNQLEKSALLQSVTAGLKRLAFSGNNDSIKLMLSNRDELDKIVDSLDLFPISEIKIPKENAIEIKFCDRFKAFEKLIDLVNFQNEKQDVGEFYKALEDGASLLCQDGETEDAI